MNKTILIFVFCFLISIAFSQENRSYDGYGNNIDYPHWGAVGSNQLWTVPAAFSDGMAAPAGQNRPNPRAISNAIFQQQGFIPDANGLSDYAWVWGQFIDHDITLVPEHATEKMDIEVPMGDPYFDPLFSGDVIIPMHRSNYDPNTGNFPGIPRHFPSMISAFIDGSGVYGSNKSAGDWLRTFSEGKMKMSNGNLLPYNTISGEYDDEIDTNAPEMAMPLPYQKYFIAGDVRANENPLLTSMHTLFVREHNRICDEIIDANPALSDEEIYQKARKIVGGLIQAVTYEEWLPTLGVHLRPHTGYNPQINPCIMNVFSAAAYRYGHTVINSEIIRMDGDGNVIPQGNILLRDAFFNPTVISDGGGLDPLFIGMGSQVEQEFDCKMIDDLRNFLFGPPGAGGLDLAALNINRGRDRGLPDYNTIRATTGHNKVSDFESFTQNQELNNALEQLYGDINNIDAWVGMLAEDHMPNTLFGESVMYMMTMQFSQLRDGDRFYYQDDAGLTQGEKLEIQQTRFVDIIMRNTGVNTMQDNVFIADEKTVSVASTSDYLLDVNVFPNPFGDQLYAEFAVEQPGMYFVRLMDVMGKPVLIQKNYVSQGVMKVELNIPGSIPSGLYVLTIDGEHIQGRKSVVRFNSN